MTEWQFIRGLGDDVGMIAFLNEMGVPTCKYGVK